MRDRSGFGVLEEGGQGPDEARWRLPALSRRMALAQGAALLLAPRPAQAQAQEGAPRRFLLVYSADGALPAYVEATAGLRAVFDAELGPGYELYSEYRDDQRFPGPEEDRFFAETMLRRHGGRAFDALLAFGETAFLYLRAHRDALWPGTPVAFAGLPASRLAEGDVPEGFYGLVGLYSIAGTLALARALQPDARRAVLMMGSSPFDRGWRATAEAELAGVEGLGIDYVIGLAMDGFRAAAAALDPGTILILLSIFEDAAGARFSPVKAAAEIAAASGAPAYGIHGTVIGAGLVGGHVERFADMGAALARLALRLAGGETALPRIGHVEARDVVDWRALRRFGLDPALLPEGALVEFHTPSAWERNRPWFLLAGGIILAQSATIAALALQGQRRRITERELVARRIELAHVSRVAQLGELSGAFAHELNQPLTSILANAEAGALLLAQEPPDLAETAETLADIAEEGRWAARLIVELRQLMTKGDKDFAPLDLVEVAGAAIRLARSELLIRGVRVEMAPAPAPLPVRGNRAQLKQVILNLLLNAAEAVKDLPPERRLVMVAAALRPDGWRALSVRDRGPGLDPALGDPFRPFATTKPEGLGLGLSICRGIAQAHGGALEFEAGLAEGARALLTLPPARAREGGGEGA